MQKEFEASYHNLEEDHFWFNARRDFVCKLISKIPRTALVLDVGCSTGVLLNDLVKIGFSTDNLYGIDISQKAISKAQEQFKNTVVMDATELQFDLKFDLIIASDCLEHIEDDKKALDSWIRHLKPNGTLIVIVPAFNFLWSHHDVVNQHFRRYKRSELKQLAGQNELQLVRSGYWNVLLFLPILFIRLIKRLFSVNENSVDGDLKIVPVVNTLLKWLLLVENKFHNFINFPFGVSAYCVWRKTS